MYRKKVIFKNLYLSIFCFVFSLLFSASTPAFFSPNAQANCALPLYLSALQGGRGNVSKTAQLTAKKQHIIAPELNRIQEEIDEKKAAIEAAIEAIAKRIGDYDHTDDEVIGDITDQIKEYAKKSWNKREAKGTYCEDDDEDSYNPNLSPSSFFAYFEAFKPPSDEIPVFNLAFLQTITKKSFYTLVPAANGSDFVIAGCTNISAPNCCGDGGAINPEAFRRVSRVGQVKTGKSECRCANGSGTPFNTGNNTDGSKCTQREPASVECGPNAGNIGGRQCKCNSTDASGSNIIFIAKPDGTNNCPTPASTPAPATVNCGPNAGNIGGRQCKCNSTDASGSNIIFIAKPDGTNNCPTPASTPAPATVNCGPNAGNIGGRQCKCNSTDASGSNIIFIAKPDGTNNCPTPASTPAPATVNCGPNAGNIGGRQCKCNSTDASGSNIIFIAKPDGTNNCPTPASTPAPQCGNHAGLIAGSSTTCQCRHLSRYGDTRFKTFPSNTNGNCPVNAPEAPSDPGAATPGGTPAGGAGTPPLGAPGETSAGGTGGGPSLNPVVPGAAGPSTNEEDPACPNWHRWGKCAGKKGAIKKLLCKNPKKCALSGGTPLENKRGKNQCLQALEDLQKFIKEIKALEEEQKTLLAEVEDIDETLRAIRTGTEADYCENCDLKRLEQLKNIIDPAPSAWQTLGNVLGTVGSAALGLYGVRSANKLRDRQGFAAQPGYAVNLAMPFIMKGLYGGGLFGKSSSLACSPTLNPGGGNVFGNPFLMQQMMQAQQQQYMQQMYLMRIFQSSGQMVPGLQGGMMVPGLQGGMMGNMMVPGFQGGMMGNMMGNMMAPGFQGNIMGSLPGFQGNIVAGWMISSMTPSFQGGMMGNMMVPGFQGGMMGPGGMMGQMMGGGMQSYFQYQQAMMAWRQAQMADQMQRYQATSGLRMQIQQLQMQMYNILNGGGSYTGGMTTTTTTGGGGGGGRTNTSGGTTDGEVIIRGI